MGKLNNAGSPPSFSGSERVENKTANGLVGPASVIPYEAVKLLWTSINRESGESMQMDDEA